ncbi:MAG: hypothetical protein M4D80_33335 [Myxococcota bacterium]|nr:hypothetical protein [Myxococcota bacterium]
MTCIALASASAGCKKKGGGGGGWLVGEQGLMVNVQDDGTLGDGYDLGASETLGAIACRYLDEAWVVGNAGTLLYTSDAGASWDSHDLGTTANLRALATQDAGPVFIAGDGVFFTSVPEHETGNAQWQQLSDGSANFRSIAAAQRASTVLAVAEDGSVYSYANGALDKMMWIDSARAVAVSPNGLHAIVVGNGISQSSDGGKTWTLAEKSDVTYNAVRIDDTGDAVAAGTNGTIAKIDAEGRVLLQQIGNAELQTLHVLGYSKRGYAAGNGGQTWITNDGGWTWALGPNVGRTVLGIDEIGLGHN